MAQYEHRDVDLEAEEAARAICKSLGLEENEKNLSRVQVAFLQGTQDIQQLLKWEGLDPTEKRILKEVLKQRTENKEAA